MPMDLRALVSKKEVQPIVMPEASYAKIAFLRERQEEDEQTIRGLKKDKRKLEVENLELSTKLGATNRKLLKCCEKTKLLEQKQQELIREKEDEVEILRGEFEQLQVEEAMLELQKVLEQEKEALQDEVSRLKALLTSTRTELELERKKRELLVTRQNMEKEDRWSELPFKKQALKTAVEKSNLHPDVALMIQDLDNDLNELAQEHLELYFKLTLACPGLDKDDLDFIDIDKKLQSYIEHYCQIGYKELQSANNKLRAKVESSHQEIEALKKEVCASQSIRDELEQKYCAAWELAKSLERQLGEMPEDTSSLGSDGSSSCITNVCMEQKKIDAIVKEEDGSISSEITSIDVNEGYKSVSMEEIKIYKAQLADVRQMNGELYQEKMQVQAELEAKERELQSLREVNEHNDRLRKEIGEANRSRDEIMKRAQELETELAEALETSNMYKEQLQGSVLESSIMLEDLTQRYETLSLKYAEAEHKLLRLGTKSYA